MSCNCNFKEPTKEDLKKINRYNWNVTLGKEHKPMRVAKLDGCHHTIGGRYGTNDLYVYPREEEPTVGNLTPFNGDVCWGYNVQQRNYYGKDEMRNGTFCTITIGGQQVYELRCGWDLMPHKIMTIINDLQEHPINICEIGYEKKIIGRKIYFRDEPGVITDYFKEQGSVIIVPDGIKQFKKACWARDDDFLWDDGETYVKEDILAKSIYWFRN